MSGPPPILEVRSVGMRFGSVEALANVSMQVPAGAVTCLLGDNGAGKSTLVSILAGVHRPTSGRYLIDGTPVALSSPRDSMAAGIAVVHQDLAVIPLMSVWRNFVLGAEPTVGWGPLARLDRRHAYHVVRSELGRLGITVSDPGRAVGTLSGGERQSLAVARALHRGARVLILDEPTAALGVRQAALVLRVVEDARDRGIGVVLVSHNPEHAYRVGDRFVVLSRGRVLGDFGKSELTPDRLRALMAGQSETGRSPGQSPI